MRKRVYVAGPISKGNLQENIDKAARAGVSLLTSGFAVYIPHLSALIEPDALVGTPRYEEWLENDFAWIEKSDAVLRLDGESAGADREVAYARDRGVLTFYSVDDIVSWFRDHP